VYKNILVPLDGKNLAEVALPYAMELAKRCGSEDITLIAAIKSTKGYKRVTGYPLGERPVSQPVGKKEMNLQNYLAGVAQKLQDEGIKAQTKIVLGKPAQAIIFYAEHNPCDLIIMATRGRAGLSRWIRGSVAASVIRGSVMPVLMVKSPGTPPGA